MQATQDVQACYLHLGSNMGDRLTTLRLALDAIEQQVGSISNVSDVYETEPWGNPNQPWFLNVAVEVKTLLPPLETLQVTQSIEHALGRQRTEHWGARTLDIDILFHGQSFFSGMEKSETRHLPLALPHPRIAERRFVLIPLADLLNAFPTPIHPPHETALQALVFCPDVLIVRRFAFFFDVWKPTFKQIY